MSEAVIMSEAGAVGALKAETFSKATRANSADIENTANSESITREAGFSVRDRLSYRHRYLLSLIAPSFVLVSFTLLAVIMTPAWSGAVSLVLYISAVFGFLDVWETTRKNLGIRPFV